MKEFLRFQFLASDLTRMGFLLGHNAVVSLDQNCSRKTLRRATQVDIHPDQRRQSLHREPGTTKADEPDHGVYWREPVSNKAVAINLEPKLNHLWRSRALLRLTSLNKWLTTLKRQFNDNIPPKRTTPCLSKGILNSPDTPPR